MKKRDWDNRPVFNLKDLTSNILYQHFKMEGLFLKNEMLLQGHKVCKNAWRMPPLQFIVSKLSVGIIFYLEDMLLITSSLKDLYTARDTLIMFLQHLVFLIKIRNILWRANINFIISHSDSRLCGNDIDSFERGSPKNPKSTQGIPWKGEGNSQGTKQTDEEVIIHSNNRCCSSSRLGTTDLETNFSKCFEKKEIILVEARKELL